MTVQEMQIFVKCLTGKTVTLIAKPSDTVEVFKRRLEGYAGATSCYRLILYLMHEHTLAADVTWATARYVRQV